VGLTIDQIDDQEQRISVRNQIVLVETAAETLKNGFVLLKSSMSR
jgi:hypothetical protein